MSASTELFSAVPDNVRCYSNSGQRSRRWHTGVKLRPLPKKLDYRKKVTAIWIGTVFNLQIGKPHRRVSDVARLFHTARREQGRNRLLKKVRGLMSNGAFHQTFVIGDQYAKMGRRRREAA